MKHLLKSAKIIQKRNPLNNQEVDIRIESGIITEIGTNLNINDATLISSENLHVSSGWIDLNANFCEPGNEHKEDLESGSKAAEFGGFTSVCLSPGTEPVIDNRSQVEFIKKFSSKRLVDLLPFGTISKSAEGKELSEMYDMWSSGAIGFMDGQKSIHNPNLLHRALRYSQSFGAGIFHRPFDNRICELGVMNEGNRSTNLGLQGIPEISEDIMVARDIELLKHSGGKLHFSSVSSIGALEKIAKAKKEGLELSCDIPSYLLFFNENDLEQYDSNLKVLPPLRAKENKKYYIDAINNGTIDAISSNHSPQAIENKAREFDHADFGMINLQTLFPSIISSIRDKVSLENVIEKLTEGPSKIINQPEIQIAKGVTANLTIFDPSIEYTFNESDIKSKSKNSPFIDKRLKGKVLGVFNNNLSSIQI